MLVSALSILAVGYSVFLRHKNNELISKNNEIQEALLKGQTKVIINRKASFHIYSIRLELINNILKHSEASDTTLTFSKNNDTIELFMRDNGVGLSKEQQENGFKNIRERVDALKAKLGILSDTEEGSRIQISIPINQPIYAALQI